jgi:dienelactone hydrolase
LIFDIFLKVIGFCYGAKVAMHFITNPSLSSSIKAAVVGHPSFLVKEEAKQIQRPILFLCAENDNFFNADLRKEFETELKSNGLGKFLDYPGTVHGFVVRPDGSEQVFKQRDKAVQDAIQFFKNNI